MSDFKFFRWNFHNCCFLRLFQFRVSFSSCSLLLNPKNNNKCGRIKANPPITILFFVIVICRFLWRIFVSSFVDPFRLMSMTKICTELKLLCLMRIVLELSVYFFSPNRSRVCAVAITQLLNFNAAEEDDA